MNTTPAKYTTTVTASATLTPTTTPGTAGSASVSSGGTAAVKAAAAGCAMALQNLGWGAAGAAMRLDALSVLVTGTDWENELDTFGRTAMRRRNPYTAIKERLGKGGRWWQKRSVGSYEYPQSMVCLQGAALSCGVWNFEVQTTLAKVINEQYPDRVPYGTHAVSNVIPYFNDNDKTKWTDIELVIEKAEVGWDEKYG